MVEVLITRNDFFRQHGVPSICLACGNPADHINQHRFQWSPFSAGFFGWTVAFYSLFDPEQSMLMLVPVCRSHDDYLWRRKALLLMPFFAAPIGALGGCVLLGMMGHTGIALLLSILAIISPLIIFEIFTHFGVRPISITDHFIRLTGVSEEFSTAMGDRHNKIAPKE